MLKKRYRLRDRRVFQQAMKGRRVCANRYFLVLGIPRQPSGGPDHPTRFGIVISKRVHKRAVRRNRIRRRLREAIRRMLARPDAGYPARGYDAIVIIVRQAAVDAGYDDLEKALETCFQPVRRKNT